MAKGPKRSAGKPKSSRPRDDAIVEPEPLAEPPVPPMPEDSAPLPPTAVDVGAMAAAEAAAAIEAEDRAPGEAVAREASQARQDAEAASEPAGDRGGEPAGAAPAGEILASSYSVAIRGLAEINAKAVDAFRTNSMAHLRFVEALMGARSLAEAIELHARHARRQFEAASGQAKEWVELARKLAHDAASPAVVGRNG